MENSNLSTETEAKGKWFFEEAVFAEALRAEALTWVGTRFCAHAQVKRAGVDCVQLAGALYVATGFFREDEFRLGWYPIDGGYHDENSRVIEWVEKSRRFARVPQAKVSAGDLLVMKIGRVEHHVGVALSETEMVHVMFRANVAIEPLARFQDRITAVYRPLLGRAAAESLQHVRD